VCDLTKRKKKTWLGNEAFHIVPFSLFLRRLETTASGDTVAELRSSRERLLWLAQPAAAFAVLSSISLLILARVLLSA